MTIDTPKMKVETISVDAKIRCYKCGSTKIAVFCHHCGRPMCSKHGPIKPLLSWLTENREFTGIDLGIWPISQKQGAHCEFHAHSGPNYRRIMIGPGIVIFIIGLILLVIVLINLGGCIFNLAPWTTINNPGIGEIFRDPGVYEKTLTGQCYMPSFLPIIVWTIRFLIVLTLGVGSILFGRKFNREKIEADIKSPGITLPIGPNSDAIQIVETLEIKLKLDYSSVDKKSSISILTEITGCIQPNFHFVSGLETKRINQYRKKYHIPESQDLHFQAGYLLLRGGSNIQITNEAGKNKKQDPFSTQYYHPDYPKLFRLNGWVFDTPPLNKNATARSSSWGRHWEYSFPPTSHQNWGETPVRIIPYMRDIGNNKTISLEIQLNTSFFKNLCVTLPGKNYLEGIDLIAIENFEIFDDGGQFGEIHSDGIVFRTDKEDAPPSYTVRWQPIYVEIQKPYIFIRDLYQISFDKEFDPNARLKGKMRVRLPALFSGLEKIEYYSALGYSIKERKDNRLPFPCRTITYLNVEFDLALSQLPVASLVLKDFPTRQEPGNNADIEMKLNFAPTAEMVYKILTIIQIYDDNNEFTSANPADQLYVYKVSESQPQMSLQEHGRWHWDVLARMYWQMQPIDIHLAIYGNSNDNSGFIQGSIQTHINPQNAKKILDAALHRLERIKKLNTTAIS